MKCWKILMIFLTVLFLKSLEVGFSWGKRYFHLLFHFTRSYILLMTPSTHGQGSWHEDVRYFMILLKIPMLFWKISDCRKQWVHLMAWNCSSSYYGFFNYNYRAVSLRKKKKKEKSIKKKSKMLKRYHFIGKDSQAFGKSVVV